MGPELCFSGLCPISTTLSCLVPSLTFFFHYKTEAENHRFPRNMVAVTSLEIWEMPIKTTLENGTMAYCSTWQTLRLIILSVAEDGGHRILCIQPVGV